MIRWLRGQFPQLRMMLISNYAEAQRAAVDAGAMEGFGKREIGSAKVARMLRAAVQGANSAAPMHNSLRKGDAVP
jgi:hypothetical protein